MSDIKNRSHPTSPTPSLETEGSSRAPAPEVSKPSSAGKGTQTQDAQTDKQTIARPAAHATSQTSLPDGLRRLQIGMQALEGKAQQSKITRLKDKIRRPAAEKRPSSPVYDMFQVHERAMDAYDALDKQDPKRLPGLSQFLIKGALLIPEEIELEWVRDTFDAHDATRSAYIVAEDGKKTIQLATMDLSIFEAFEASGKLRDFVVGLSADTLFPVYLKHEAVEFHAAKSLKPFKKPQIDFRDASGKVVKIPQANTAKVRLVTALTLRALYEKNDHVAALLIGASPILVMKEITSLPFQGNIFSNKALVTILRHLTPKGTETSSLSQTASQRNSAASLCIGHYLKHSPLHGLEPAVNPVVNKMKSTFRNQHLLLQNPSVLVRETALLLDQIIAMTTGKPVHDANKSFAESAGWQAATLVGSIFKYVQDTAEELSATQRRVSLLIGRAARVAQSVTQLGASYAGPISGAEGILTEVEQSTADYLASKAIRSDPKLDLEELAGGLASLSDRLKKLAETGLLAPGLEKINQNSLASFNDRTSPLRIMYKTAGKLFLENYSNHLQDFSQRELERTTLASVENIR